VVSKTQLLLSSILLPWVATLGSRIVTDTSTDNKFPRRHLEESHELFDCISCHGMESDVDIPVTSQSLGSDSYTCDALHSLTFIPLYSYGILGPVIFSIFREIHNANFFQHQHEHKLGAAMLVSNLQFNSSKVAHLIPEVEVDLHMNIAALLSTLTRKQRDDLSTIFHQVVNITIARQGVDVGQTQSWHTKIPTSVHLIRTFYIRGKHAVLPNVPRPEVKMINNHAYVSLIDCVADVLGHGLPLDIIKTDTATHTVAQLSECKVAKEIYSRAVNNSFPQKPLCLYIAEWSDAFEPSSCTKNNRGSCWIKSITVCPPSSELHKLTYTYPVAIGRDADDHTCTEEIFASELNEFQNRMQVPFYYGTIKCL
jgi:hypothetical protein